MISLIIFTSRTDVMGAFANGRMTRVLAFCATARNGGFDVMIPANGKGRTVVKAAGTVDYYCKFHPNMVGKLVVEKK